MSDTETIRIPASRELRDATRTPRPLPADYDWRKESWAQGEKSVRMLSSYIAMHVITALAAGDPDDEDEQDDQVLGLLSPETTERIVKGPMADEIVDYRLACAASIGIDKLITKWIARLGSIDADGSALGKRLG